MPVRHVEQGVNVPMYRTVRRCRPAGSISGPLVVSMRPVPAAQVADAVRVTSRYPAVHGAPGARRRPGRARASPTSTAPTTATRRGPARRGAGVLGVRGDAAGAVMESRPSLAIAHAPGHMLITDARDSDYLVP